MKLLVVDDEHSFAALLGRALKRLGHQAVIATLPDDALHAFRAGGVDAVITKLDMPGMSGLELTAMLRGESPGLPIAFCTAADGGDRERANQIGPVLPKVWTVAVLKDVVAALEVAVRQLARGSANKLAQELAKELAPTAPVPLSPPPPPVPDDVWVEPWTATSIPEVDMSDVPSMPPSMLRQARGTAAPPTGAALVVPAPPPRRPPSTDHLATEDGPVVRRPRTRSTARKIRVSCKTWDHVTRLCMQKAAGKNVLTIRGTHGLQVGEPVIVALALPDELVLSLPAEVAAVKPQPDGTSVFGIALIGLTDEICVRLESMVAAQRTAPIAVPVVVHVKASLPRKGIVVEPRRARHAGRPVTAGEDSEVSA